MIASGMMQRKFIVLQPPEFQAQMNIWFKVSVPMAAFNIKWFSSNQFTRV